jgi:excinuclease UvrABC nuclease subunit
VLNEMNFEIIEKGTLDYKYPIKDCCYIYMLYNSKGDLSYIGQTKNLFHRLSQHSKNKKIVDISKCEFYLVHSKNSIQIEEYLIFNLKPINSRLSYNNTDNSWIKEFYTPREKNKIQMTLKEFLKSKELTVGEFAKNIGYTRETIQNYLKGHSRLSRRAAFFIEKYTEGIVSSETVLNDNPVKKKK